MCTFRDVYTRSCVSITYHCPVYLSSIFVIVDRFCFHNKECSSLDSLVLKKCMTYVYFPFWTICIVEWNVNNLCFLLSLSPPSLSVSLSLSLSPPLSPLSLSLLFRCGPQHYSTGVAEARCPSPRDWSRSHSQSRMESRLHLVSVCNHSRASVCG